MDVGAKKRKVTPCYWESQPQGCTKPHCAFLHQQPKDPVKQGDYYPSTPQSSNLIVLSLYLQRCQQTNLPSQD